MKVLSVKQPWAYLLCAGVKDIENRTWKLPEKYKGERVLIHASAKSANFWKTTKAFIVHKELAKIPIHEFDRTTGLYSAIIGSVRFVDCTINHPSIWAEKTEVIRSVKLDEFLMPSGFEVQEGKPIYNWVATDAVLFEKPILNVKGKLSFWDYDLPDEYVKLINDYDNGKKDL